MAPPSHVNFPQCYLNPIIGCCCQSTRSDNFCKRGSQSSATLVGFLHWRLSSDNSRVARRALGGGFWATLTSAPSTCARATSLTSHTHETILASPPSRMVFMVLMDTASVLAESMGPAERCQDRQYFAMRIVSASQYQSRRAVLGDGEQRVLRPSLTEERWTYQEPMWD
jgi:hypothetical protein